MQRSVQQLQQRAVTAERILALLSVRIFPRHLARANTLHFSAERESRGDAPRRVIVPPNATDTHGGFPFFSDNSFARSAENVFRQPSFARY